MAGSFGYIVYSNIGKPNCFGAKIAFLRNVVHEHDCWYHSKWTLLPKDLVIWNGYNAVIIPELSWLCWKKKGMVKSCIQKCILGMVFSLDFDFQFLLSLKLCPFPRVISAFHFWSVLEKSSLITVFSSESQIVSRVLL